MQKLLPKWFYPDYTVVIYTRERNPSAFNLIRETKTLKDRQPDRQTDRHRDRQTDRQTMGSRDFRRRVIAIFA